MYLGRRLPPVIVLVAAAALVASAAIGGSEVPWVVLATGIGLVVALVAMDVILAPSPRLLQARRQAPGVLRLRRPAQTVVSVHNPAARSVEVALHDTAMPSLGREPRRQFATIPPDGWLELGAEVTPTRRGRFQLGPMTIRTSGPLGLAGRQATLRDVHALKVYPALKGRDEVALRLRRGRLLQAGVRSSAIRGGGSDFDAVREYLPDDEFRRINWRATARSPSAITNLYREERNQQLILLLDASRAMAAQVEGVARLEHALDAAVAVAELGSRIGDHVGVLAFGQEVRAQLDPRGSRDQPHRIIDLLFGIQPRLEAPNYGGAFAGVLRRHRRRALMVLFTDLSERSVLEPLLQAVPVLLSRHVLLVAAVRDPEVEFMARAAPATSAEAYEKAAAAGFLEWRDAAAALLRRMGVPTFDLHPQELAGRMADEYLRIKALGRL
jgi:uncharacterized protein (DUF58 family)